mmetsp:Transcript_11412/g.51764  ORF Transcript_11412/g.51764 Transcript_11412/m.51764 type:complete len:372 (-) Transcript_11412:78-1193(-)
MPASTRGSRGAAPKAKATKVKAIAKTKAKPAAKNPAAKKPAAKPKKVPAKRGPGRPRKDASAPKPAPKKAPAKKAPPKKKPAPPKKKPAAEPAKKPNAAVKRRAAWEPGEDSDDDSLDDSLDTLKEKTPPLVPQVTWTISMATPMGTLPVAVTSLVTVADIKQLVTEKTGGRLPPDRQIVKLNDRLIDDFGATAVLANHGLRDKSMLTLSFTKPAAKSPGGGVDRNRDHSRALVTVPSPPKERRTGPQPDSVTRRVGPRAVDITKAQNKWTREESELVVEGVARYGYGLWAKIQKELFADSKRTSVDVKDKWRNLVKAADKPDDFKFRSATMDDVLREMIHEAKAKADEMQDTKIAEEQKRQEMIRIRQIA